MTSNQIIAFYIVASFVAFVCLYRRREAVAHMVRGTIVACIGAAAVFFFLWKAGLPPLDAYIVALVFGILIRRAQPRRSRYIPARVRRQVIARWERESGQSFNKRVHELDHVLAHSRGGGNMEENLQVLTKKQNRSKGAGRRSKD